MLFSAKTTYLSDDKREVERQTEISEYETKLAKMVIISNEQLRETPLFGVTSSV